MKSKHSEKFNHDDEAAGYDMDVQNESQPIRAGYRDLLNWVAKEANSIEPKVVLDLGTGTGNLVAMLGSPEVVCVDVSEKMLEIARDKLHGKNTEFVRSDLLEFFDHSTRSFDCVVSTYAIHHLEPVERKHLFQNIWQALPATGSAIFGDLMFENKREKEELYKRLIQAGRENVVNGIEEEYFWDVESDGSVLEAVGFKIRTARFSKLSWGILAQKNYV